jgi:hypothetical protein
MFDEQSRGFFVFGEVFWTDASIGSVDELQSAATKRTNDVQGQSLFPDFFTKDDITTKHGSSDMIFRPADGAGDYSPFSVGRGD